MVGCAGHTYAVADFLLYEAFRQHSPKIKLPNGMLERDGISRMSKLRALRNLEQRGLVSVAWRKRKSPIVTLNL